MKISKSSERGSLNQWKWEEEKERILKENQKILYRLKHQASNYDKS